MRRLVHSLLLRFALVCFGHIAKAEDAAPALTAPVCDVAIDSAICLNGGQKVLLPHAQQYGLELYLDFESIRPIDESGKQNHASGEVMAAAGITGGISALFRNNYVYVPHTESFESADFSYTFFLYVLEDDTSRNANAAHDQYCPILHKGTMKEDVQEAGPAILVNPRDGRIKVVVATSSSLGSPGEEMLSNSRLRPHHWYHMAVVRRMNRVRLYVDGILDSTFVTQGTTRTNDLPIYIGGAPYSEDVCDFPLLLDELREFSYVCDNLYEKCPDHLKKEAFALTTEQAIGRDQIQAEASIALNGVEPSFIHIGCVDCNKDEASTACPDGYHLCNKLELYIGGYHVARKLSLGTNLVAAGSATPAKGTALCCADM